MASGVGRVSDIIVPFSTPQVPAADEGAPVFATQPSIFASQASGVAFGNDGNASYAMRYTRRWLLNGAAIGRQQRLQLAGLSGALVYEVTAYGPAGQPTVATSPAVNLAGANPPPAVNAILTEDGNQILNEDGSVLTLES